MNVKDILNKFNSVKTVKDLIISLLIFIIVPAVLGVVTGLLSWIPVIGWVLGIITTLIGILCLVGIILSILGFLKNNAK
ncbi:MAG: hypothetical protein ACI4QX_10150 [Lachnospiraceae bacterium]